MKKNILRFTFFCMALLPAGFARAGEIGHYAAGMFGPWDLITPARGTAQVAAGMAYYNTSIARGMTDVDLDLPQAIVMLRYAPDFEILGATYSLGVLPTYGRTSINAYHSRPDFERDKVKDGWSDLYAIPANLTWDLGRYLMLSAQYAFWAPTGSYESGRELNNGLGYWSHDFRVTGSVFPTGSPKTLLSVSSLYELNTKKRGHDIHPGDRLGLEFGASHVFNEYLIIGLIAAANWEITQTTGSEATDNGKDRVFSAGPEATLFLVPGKWSLSLRYLKEFAAKDRAEGQFFYAFLGYQF